MFLPHGFQIEVIQIYLQPIGELLLTKKPGFYFESALTPNTFWVDLKKIDFSYTASAKN